MIYLAAILIVAGVALFVAAPLSDGALSARPDDPGEGDIRRLERERALAVQALRELEFDREMGKVSPADYETMRTKLEERALTAMSLSDQHRARASVDESGARLSVEESAGRPTSLTKVARSPRPAGIVKFCSQCGNPARGRFCAQCGAALTLGARPAIKHAATEIDR